DELRAKTVQFKKRIADFIAQDENQIKELRDKLENQKDTLSVTDKEDIYEQIKKLEKVVKDKIEEVLLQILPEAFAVLKETARRFNENNEVVVAANEYDRELATIKQNVRIEGDKAFWANRWMAAGNEVKW